MRIEVIVSGWEQACCGTPFHVGAQATWQLLAEVPSMALHPELPVFRDEHHGQTEPGIPHWDVTGTVRSISAVTFPAIEMPGHSRTFTSDRSRPEAQPVEAVGQSVDDDVSEYHVVLDVDDDTALPGHAVSAEETARNSYEERQSAVQGPRRADEVGQLLEAHADYAQERFATAARMLRATYESAVTLEPHAAGAAAVRWARSDVPDRDGIIVQIGEGSGSFPAQLTHAAAVREMLDAAALGRVEERVRSVDGLINRLTTIVHGEDGTSWVTEVDVEIRSAGESPFFVVGPLWQRIQRGDHGYTAWGSGPSEHTA
jgi:hypothetical protein